MGHPWDETTNASGSFIDVASYRLNNLRIAANVSSLT